MCIWMLLVSLFAAQAQTEPLSLERLSLEEKVGQMFIFGFAGTSVTPQLKKHFQELKPGALLIFGRNIRSLSQISQLNSDLQKTALHYSSTPLFLAVDQEGGWVSRIKTSPSLPSAYTIGATNDPTLAFQSGKVTGEMLQLLGFNMNLAPVLDVTDDRLSSFIATRSFSESPHKISSMGVAFAQGLAESKVVPIAKHFPGHGPIALDTHKMTPSRQISYQELTNTDLVPFVQFSNADIQSGIMVAHIAYPQIDPSHMPATFSKKLISDVLLNELKYKGLVMTDDIEMAGASSLRKVEDRVLAAVAAGNDLIMLGWSPALQKKAVKAVLAAVRAGTLTESRINASVKKILQFKSHYASTQLRAPSSGEELKAEMKNISFASIFNDIISRFFKSLPGLEASAESFTNVVLVSNSNPFTASFRRYLKSPRLQVASSMKSKPRINDSSLLLYYISGSAAFNEVLRLPENLRTRTVVVSSYSKARLQNKGSFLDVIEVYSNHPNLGGFAADAVNRSQKQVSPNQ